MKTFLDDGLGWENVSVRQGYKGRKLVYATLASSEDPISEALLTPGEAREYAAALIAAADYIEEAA